MITFKLKNFKENISFCLGQSLYGEKWVEIFAGSYGMDLFAKDGNGGSKPYYG